METVTTAILDRFPNFRQKKVWVVLTVAVFGYLGGLIFTTNVRYFLKLHYILLRIYHSLYFNYHYYLSEWHVLVAINGQIRCKLVCVDHSNWRVHSDSLDLRGRKILW